MNFVWASAKKDLRRRLRDPLAFLLWIGIPLLIGGLIVLAFGGKSGPRPKAHVLVANHDDSFVADLLARALGQGGSGEFFVSEAVEEAAGRERMDAGEASALLVIPAGFGDAVLEERPTRLVLVTNPAERILPGMVEEAVSLLVDGVFYVHRAIDDDLRREIREIAAGPPAGERFFADGRVAAFSARINDTVRRLGRYLFPPVIELETVVPEKEEPGEKVTLGILFFPSMVFMALFFIAQGLSDDVWREREEGTLRRLVTTPRQVSSFLLGKLLSSLLLVLVIAAVAMLFAALAFGLEPGRVLAATLWTTLSGTVLTAFMMLVQLQAGTQNAGHLLTNVFLFPLLMIGGSFFPFEAMPAWMAAIGRRTPNGWALEVLKNLILGRAEPGSVAIAFAGLAAAGGLLVFLCSLRLRHGFARG